MLLIITITLLKLSDDQTNLLARQIGQAVIDGLAAAAPTGSSTVSNNDSSGTPQKLQRQLIQLVRLQVQQVQQQQQIPMVLQRLLQQLQRLIFLHFALGLLLFVILLIG